MGQSITRHETRHFLVSRSQSVSMAWLLPSFIYGAIIPVIAVILHHGYAGFDRVAILILAAIILFSCLIVIYEIHLLWQMLKPGWIEITPRQVRRCEWGQISTWQWTDLGEPVMTPVSAGRAAVRSIEIPIPGGKSLSLLADRFAQPLDQVFAAFLQAKSSQNTHPVPKLIKHP